MVSRSEIERLKLEADTIVTRYQEVEQALERARNEDGEHWETGALEMTLETPNGEEIDVALDLHENPARNAQARYDQVAEREAEQDGEASEEKHVEKAKHKKIPTWEEAITVLVSSNLETRGKNSGGGGSRGRGRRTPGARRGRDAFSS